jgi:hypothetical protein
MSDFINVSASGSNDGVKSDAVNALTGEKRSTAKSVLFRNIRCDANRNPREESVYTDSRNTFLARSINDFGFDPNEPISVSQRADGLYWVIKGHRRYHAVKTLIEAGLPAVTGESPSPAVGPNPERFKEIPCLVFKGLTLTEELDLLMDHGGIIKLNEREQVRAAREMTGVFSHEIIAKKLGMSRSNYTNGIGKLFVLPECVMTHFLTPESKDNKLPKLTQAARKILVEEHNKDMKLPDARIRVGGPNFMGAWEKFLKEGAPTTPKAMSRDTIEALFGTLSPATDQDIMDLLQAVHDNNTANASTAIARLKMSLKIAGNTVGTNRVTIEEGIVKPISNGEYTDAVQDATC